MAACACLIGRTDRVNSGALPAEAVFEALVAAFPGKTAKALKTYLVGGLSSKRALAVREENLLRVMLDERFSTAFGDEAFGLGRRIANSWLPGLGEWSSAALAWFVTADVSPPICRIRTRILRAMSVEQLRAIHGAESQLLVKVLGAVPEWLEHEELWRETPAFQRACMEAWLALPRDHRAAAIASMVGSASFACIQELTTGIEPVERSAVLSLLNRQWLREGTYPSQRWCDALDVWPDAVANFCGHTGRGLSAGMVLLAGRAGTEVLQRVQSRSILEIARMLDESEQSVEVAAYALALALSEECMEGAEVTALVAQPVHSALMSSSLPSRAWRRLESLLPRLEGDGAKDWDLAERLTDIIHEARGRHADRTVEGSA